MLSNITKIEAKVGSKIFTFLCDMESDFPSVKEALCQFISYVVQMEHQLKAQQDAQAQAQAKISQDAEKPAIVEVPSDQPSI